MTETQHQLNFQIADTLEKLQDLNPDLYGFHYSQLYAPHGNPENWTIQTLNQIQQDLIDNAK